MKITFAIPVNIGDNVYCVRNQWCELDKSDIDIVKIQCFLLNEKGLFVLDDMLDWYGNINDLNKPISETEVGDYCVYSTMENAINSIKEWNQEYRIGLIKKYQKID